jgi:hypothetical protein
MKLVRQLRARTVWIIAVVGMLALVAAILSAPARAVAESTGGSLFVVKTGRILDTRNGTGGYTTAMPAGSWRAVQITGKAGIPSSSVTAVALNFTEVSPSSLGQLVARPNLSVASTLVGTYDGGNTGTTSNQGVVAVNSDGTIQVAATTDTNLVIDVDGYYTNAAGVAGGFVPVSGQQVIGAGSVAVGSNLSAQVAGTGGIPANATAVVADFIVNNQGTSAGYIAPGPAGTAVPTMALNYPSTKGMATAISAQVALSPDGKIEVWNRAGSSIKVNVDIEGYFLPGSSAAGQFNPGSGRVYDSRTAPHVAIGPGKIVTIPLGGTKGIPNTSDGLSAVVIDLTAVHGSSDTGGYAKAWADGTSEPGAFSDIEYAPNSIRSNTNTVPVGVDGAIEIHNVSTASVDFVLDIEGWYAGASSTLCARDATTISNVSTTGASDGVLTLGAAVVNGLGESTSTDLYVIDSSGNAVGGSPTASGVIESGTSAVFHPTGLTTGAKYTWWIHAAANDACASQATSARQSFTVGHEATSPLPLSTFTVSGPDLGVVSGPASGTFSSSPVTVGSDGNSAWVSEMKLNFDSMPAGARIVQATLHGGAVSCISSVACAGSSASVIPVSSDVEALSTPDDALAIPATADSVPITGTGGDVDVTPLVESWYNGGPATNTGAVIAATGGGGGFRLSPTTSIEIAYAAATAPSAPTLLRATPGDGGVLVSWAPPTDSGFTDVTGVSDGVTSYTVSVVPATGGSAVATTTVSGTSATISGLTNGSAYTITVRATNPVGAGALATTGATPTAVPGGSSIYVNEVQGLVAAQTRLETGAASSTDEAAGGSSAVRDGLGVNGSQLVEDSDSAALAGQAITDGTPSLSNTLVGYDTGTGLVTVYTSVTDTGSTVDTSDPDNPVTIATSGIENVAFTLTTGSSPAFVATSDTAAVAYPLSSAASDTLRSSTDNTTAGAAPLQLDSDSGLISATQATSSATSKSNTVKIAAVKHVNVNYGGIASWANKYASSSFDNGYGDDCTDFAARAMYYGGGMHMVYPSGVLPHIDSNDSHWYHAGNVVLPRYSRSWGTALDSLAFLEHEGTAVSHSQSNTAPGDIVYVNWSGDSSGRHIDHAGVIVKVTKNNVYIAQHTSNRVDSLQSERGYHSWRGSNPHLYLWITRPVESK